jgi:hypothetical protein
MPLYYITFGGCRRSLYAWYTKIWIIEGPLLLLSNATELFLHILTCRPYLCRFLFTRTRSRVAVCLHALVSPSGVIPVTPRLPR